MGRLRQSGAGSGATSIVTAVVQDTDGNLIPAADVRIEGAAPMGPLGSVGTLYYRAVTAPDAPGDVSFDISVGCGDGSRISLNARPTLSVVPGPAAGAPLATGGCSPVSANVSVTVLDAEGRPVKQDRRRHAPLDAAGERVHL